MQSFKMAIKSILGNKLRSVLTMLGIIIGVMALVILVSLVSGATSSVTDKINALGSNLMTITISDDKNDPISFDDLTEWVQSSEAVGNIAPSASETMTGKYEGSTESITVYGTTASYVDVQELKLMLGRFLKTVDVDNTTNVCVINETAATDLIGYTDCLDSEISLNGMKFLVVGVLEDDDESLTSMFSSGSSVAYIPYPTLVRLSTSVQSSLTTLYVSSGAGHEMSEAEEAMTEILMDRFGDDEDAFSISSQNALESATASITSILTILLGGIAAISLVVGGIGIMNIMLVTVTERTREIGIRKAIGATRGAILRQFLLEAVMLSMLGCLIGIFFSWVVLQLITIIVSSLSLSFDMNANVVIIAVSFCLAIGVIFGIYPANKAATMKPIDALHYGG